MAESQNVTGQLTDLIRQWVKDSAGWFTYTSMDADLKIASREAKTLRRGVLLNLVKDGIVERMPGKNATFRRFQTELTTIDWQSADAEYVIDLKFPFGLENWVKLFPKSIVVVAGESNAGKTAFLYNFILQNYPDFIIDLYNSETSPEQMKERFDNFDANIPVPAPFTVYERYDNFADVIHPDHISVIDYIDFSEDVWRIGVELDHLHRKLRNGVVIAAVQKKGSYFAKGGQKITPKLGYGAEMSLKKASLYVSMSSGKLEIVKGKSWRDNTVNPNGMTWDFKLVKGSKFILNGYTSTSNEPPPDDVA